ncbi:MULTISPECIES: hypothetical protein [Deinococcus]|uniref:Uncharacterized protein n=1 Tax=Deinococcus rufus TaxID=2136097 RepID=A0ABV7Z8Q7_9DEIO|nr:hypothetical protein [Deinococcus sp. AB2017081]WQE94435.1 hypothetical protein U2P90_13600 [Deinococcus sp. AB2017081]
MAGTILMIFELQLVTPQTYATYSFFKNVANIKTKKSYNNIGSFSFSVLSSFSDFDRAITTPEGQGQVVIYADGKPYLHGVIDTYSPTESGFVDVSCTEILQLLKDDIIVGDYKLSNYKYEYLPEASPIQDRSNSDFNEAEVESYWGQYGDSYFVADIYSDSEGTYVNAIDDGQGVSYYGAASGVRQKIYPRWLINNRQTSYILKMEGTGFPRNFYYVGSHNWSNKTSTETQNVGDGIYTTAAPINPSQTTPGGLFNVGPYYLYIKTKNGSTNNFLMNIRIDPFTSVLGRKIIPYFMLYNSPFKAVFSYSEDATTFYVGLSITFNVDGEDYTYSNQASFNKSYYNGAYNAQAFFMVDSVACKYHSFRFEEVNKENHLDWLNRVSDSISFIRTTNALTGYSWSLKYTDADKWQIVSKILELGGNATLEYAGIADNKPTYYVHNYSNLEELYKFANGDEIFNVRYEKDFSDTYNVLVASAKRTTNQGNSTLVTTYSITIAPNPDRPNRLGRLKKKIANPSGIEDIETLTQWALSVYDEHSAPSEPVSFNSILDSFWLKTLPGQYITIHGLLEGQTIVEQVNNISIDEGTGTVSVELAKRLTLKSALIEARLAAE